MTRNEFAQAAVKPAEQADVIILGAGIAGLSAALELADRAKAAGRPLSITILEAADKVGGRTKTETVEGEIMDTGAHWFHGGEQNPMFRWVKERYPQLATGIDDVSSQFSVEKGRSWGKSFRTDNLAMMEKIYLAFKKEHPGEDTSLEKIAELSGDHGAKETARFFARCWMAEEDPANISADEFFASPYGPGGGTIKGGVAAVVQCMKKELEAAGVKILTGRKAAVVRQSAAGATVLDSAGRIYKAQQAIDALPVGVMQKKDIAFFPALPAKTQEYIDRINISHFTKILVPVHPEFLDAMHIPANTHIDILDKETFCHARPDGKPFLTLMAGGEEAVRVEKMDAQELSRFVKESLGCIPQLAGWEQAVTGPYHTTHWNTDPLERGAYTSMKVGMHRMDPPHFGRVTICGEAFAGEKDELEGPSMMVGAWFSGRKAADAAWADLENISATKPAARPVAMPAAA